MMHRKIVERVYRRLLKESKKNVPIENLALFRNTSATETTEGERLGGVYDATVVENFLNSELFDELSEDEREQELLDTIYSAAVAVIQIAHSGEQGYGNCRDAWIVHAAAGPGYGKLVYSVGYELSSSGKLIPDRRSLTSDAINAWMKVKQKSEGEPLDDIENPKTPDKSDDCVVWPVTKGMKSKNKLSDGLGKEYADVVNRAYALGNTEYDTGQMIARDFDVARIAEKKGMKGLMNIFNAAFIKFWKREYRG